MPDDDYDGIEEAIDDPTDLYEESSGSCSECGCNLYADDVGEMCGQCSWWLAQAGTD